MGSGGVVDREAPDGAGGQDAALVGGGLVGVETAVVLGADDGEAEGEGEGSGSVTTSVRAQPANSDRPSRLPISTDTG